VYPQSAAAVKLANELSEKYGAPVLPVNCLQLDEKKIKEILRSVLFEFPLKKVVVTLPGWLSGIREGEPIRAELLKRFLSAGNGIRKVRELPAFVEALRGIDTVTYSETQSVLLGEGTAYVNAEIDKSVFYGMITEITGIAIENDASLVEALSSLAGIKKKYEKIEAALKEAESTGYGIVMPSTQELSLEEPEIVKQGSRYGVRLKASAPSIHMLRADIKTEVAPIVGSEKQSEDLVKYLLEGFQEDPSKIWESNIFGKSLDDLVNEGLKAKLMHMPNEARMKLQQTLERVINEGCNGLICIII
jgi:stage IV sporulation protein A